MEQIAIRDMVTALPGPALAINAEGRVTCMNAGAIEVLGADRSDLHYITALRQPTLLDAVEATQSDSTARVARFLGRAGRKDTTWHVHVRALPGAGLLLSFEDMTLVEEAHKIRQDFIANLSHELRTPLTALLGFIETLSGPARDDAAARARFLEIMAKEAGRMASLVDDLLSLSRVEETERQRPTAPVSLRGLICETCNALQGVAEQAGLALVCDLSDTESTVPGDEGQLRQVLLNLVENALKYGAGGEKVEIILRRSADEPSVRGPAVMISVRDYGEGIESHHLARLTERFYRVDSHRSREIGGTGLGLAIVKHIVNRHRGRLRIESKIGEGSVFTAIFPVD